MLEDTKEFAKDSRPTRQYLSVIETAAKAAGVPCDIASATHDHPYEAIIKVAKSASAISSSWHRMAGRGCRRFCSGARLRRY
jgi:hypothetical protein